jgi:hypothetical protein
MTKMLFWLAICTVFVGIVIDGAWNYFTVSRPVDTALALNSRNQGVQVRLHYQNYLNTSVLSFDLRVSGHNSMADVFRVFLQSAKVLRSHDFQKVELRYRGDIRFLVEGTYFKQLGNEFDFQNPVYTMRTFTSHLYQPDGEKAFSEWTGGWLGVITKEMEQFDEFHKQWYLAALSAP